MITYILSSIFITSTSFNGGMMFYKQYDTKNRIKKKYEDMGYIVDKSKLKKLFSYNLDEYYNSDTLNQILYEVIALLPVINLIFSKYNMEYLMSNYEHNKYFDNIVQKSSEGFMLYNGLLKKKILVI